MNSREELINIYLIYKDLLTKKQQDYFKYYYFEDLSLSEISENMLVSKALIVYYLMFCRINLAKLQISFNLCNFFGNIFAIIAFFCIFVLSN